MMNINLGVMACLLFIATTVAQAKNPIEEQVSRISDLRGESYIEERDLFLDNVNAEMLEKLREMRDNKELDWKIRAQVGILVERHEYGSEFEELVKTNWLEDPEFDPNWMKSRAGPLAHTYDLQLKRYREAGFWYLYFERLVGSGLDIIHK